MGGTHYHNVTTYIIKGPEWIQALYNTLFHLISTTTFHTSYYVFILQMRKLRLRGLIYSKLTINKWSCLDTKFALLQSLYIILYINIILTDKICKI